MTARPRPLVAGNWKMNGLAADALPRVRDLVERMAREPAPCDVLVCPPATLLAQVASATKGTALLLGGQDCHASEKGAHTGDIAAAMLADAGCRYVIVGHSERRRDHGEDDATVKAKAAAAHKAGLVAIVCLGERQEERDAGSTKAVVTRQLAGSLPEGATAANTVVAYEPVWAIGTGRTATLEQIAEVHGWLRAELAARLKGEGAGVRLLYGGSVTGANAAGILATAEVDGALVGGASLKADEFWTIARSCAPR